MSTDEPLDIEPRGLLEVGSKAVVLKADGKSALRAIAVERDIGGTCELLVSVDRTMVPFSARLLCDSKSIPISLEAAILLMESKFGESLYNTRMANVIWETVLRERKRRTF